MEIGLDKGTERDYTARFHVSLTHARDYHHILEAAD